MFKPSAVKWAEEELESHLKWTNLVKLKYYLKVYFRRMGNNMFLSQSAYCSSTRKKFRMKIAKTA